MTKSQLSTVIDAIRNSIRQRRTLLTGVYAIRGNTAKTLRITGIIAAALVAIFIIFPAVFGVRSDESSGERNKLLNSPGTIEQFKKLKGSKARATKSQISPLVEQAQAFALYLNPPKPKPKRPAPSRATPGTKPRPIVPVSPKFKLLGTSFYASHPELSLALIDEPGKGPRWVRQSSEVGHLIFEQIKDGLVVVRDGQRTFELPVVERPPKKSLLKDEGTPFSKAISKPIPSVPAKTSANTIKTRSRSRPPQVTTEESSLMEQLMRTLQRGSESDKADSKSREVGEEKEAMMERFISDLKAMRIGAEEAKKLGHLGKELKSASADPNRAKDRSDKIETDSQEPNRPAEK